MVASLFESVRNKSLDAVLVPLLPREGQVVDIAVGAASATTLLTAAAALGTGARTRMIGLHATVDCYVLLCNAAGDAVAATTGVPLRAGEKFYGVLSPGYEHLAVIRDAADGKVRAWIASP